MNLETSIRYGIHHISRTSKEHALASEKGSVLLVETKTTVEFGFLGLLLFSCETCSVGKHLALETSRFDKLENFNESRTWSHFSFDKHSQDIVSSMICMQPTEV